MRSLFKMSSFRLLRLFRNCAWRKKKATQEMPQSQSTAFPRHRKKERGRTNKDNTNATYETTVPVIYSTDCFKAVVPVLVWPFVASRFILQGDLLYVLPCVILFLCFSVLIALSLPRLGKRELILVLFVRLFDLRLFGFVCFLFLLMSGKGCGLWLWHSLDFSLTIIFWNGQKENY